MNTEKEFRKSIAMLVESIREEIELPRNNFNADLITEIQRPFGKSLFYDVRLLVAYRANRHFDAKFELREKSRDSYLVNIWIDHITGTGQNNVKRILDVCLRMTDRIELRDCFEVKMISRIMIDFIKEEHIENLDWKG